MSFGVPDLGNLGSSGSETFSIAKTSFVDLVTVALSLKSTQTFTGRASVCPSLCLSLLCTTGCVAHMNL